MMLGQWKKLEGDELPLGNMKARKLLWFRETRERLGAVKWAVDQNESLRRLRKLGFNLERSLEQRLKSEAPGNVGLGDVSSERLSRAVEGFWREAGWKATLNEPETGYRSWWLRRYGCSVLVYVRVWGMRGVLLAARFIWAPAPRDGRGFVVSERFCSWSANSGAIRQALLDSRAVGGKLIQQQLEGVLFTL